MDMSSAVGLAFKTEIELAAKYKINGFSADEWNHLERAHILGQFFALKHLYVHILMIGYSIRQGSIGEFIGQIPRILLAIPGSVFKLAPKGNTGGSDVGIFQPMPVPEDIQKILKAGE